MDDGDNGRGILSTEIKYGTSDSASTQPSSWSSAVPTSIEAGKWLWVRTVINYTDNTSDTTYQKSYVGTDGKDGKSVYIQSATKDGDATTVVIADSDGNTNTLTIVDGQDGPDGQPGAGGYVHTAWANSADGTTDFSTTVSAGKKYLGVYTDHTQADSMRPADYSWSLIKGDKGDTGKALTGITEYYARNNSTTAPADSAFSTSVKTPTASEKYVWNYEQLSWNDNGTTSTTKTAKHIVAVYGDQGNTGKALTKIEEYYAINNSTTAPADSSFDATVKAPTVSNKYLWNYELLTWNDNGTTSTTKTDKHIAAVYGDKGDDGKDAYTVILTNESHTFAGSTTAALAGSTTCNVVAYKGATQMAATIGTITGQPTGMTTSITSNGTTSAYFTVTVTTEMTTKNGVLTVPVTVDGKSFSMKFTYSLALKGEQGEQGDKGEQGADSGNMLLDVYAPSVTKINAKYNRYFSDAANTSTVCSFVSAGNETLPDPNAKYFVRIKNTELNKYRALCFYGSANYENASGLVVGDTYKVSCWVRQLEGSSNFLINLGGLGGAQNDDTTFVPTAEWQKYEKVFAFSDSNETSTVWSRLYFYNRAGAEINGAGTGIGQIDMCGFKLERINAITASGRNVCLRSADYRGWGTNNGTTFEGNIITFPTVTTNMWREAWQNNNVPYSVVRNQKVTVTCKVKGTANDLIVLNVSLGLVASETSNSRLKYVNKYHRAYASGEWQTVAFSAYVNDYIFALGSGTPDYDNCYFTVRVGAGAGNDDHSGFQLKEIMVALGSDPCAWSPAPEDGVAHTDESIEAIEIGGKNILTKSETMDGWYKGSGTTIADGVATITGNASNWNSVLCSSKYDISVYDGSEYIWSFEYKSTADCYIVKNISATGATVDSTSYARTKFTYWNSNATLPSSGGEWKKFVLPSRTISLSDLTTGSGNTVSGFLQLYNRTTGVALQVRHMKLEKGNKATDWSPAPEDEANARKLLIREVNSGSTQGIEVGYENGSYKAFINAAGSFDVINAAGETVASFGSDVAMKSARESYIDEMGNGYYSQNFMNIKSGEIQLKRIIDGSAGIYDGTYISGLTAEGIKPSGTNSFILHDGVYAEEETNLWYTTDNVGTDGLVGECFVAGWVTGSSKEVMFTIPLTAPIANNYDVEATSLLITVRQNNKYLAGSADGGKEIVGASDTDDLEVFQCPSGINVHYYRTSAFSGATNNETCGIKVEYQFGIVENQ